MPYIFDIAAGAFAPGKNGNVPEKPGESKGRQRMARLFKLVFVLGILGFLGLAGYAYLGDLAPDPQEIRQPVTLNGG